MLVNDSSAVLLQAGAVRVCQRCEQQKSEGSHHCPILVVIVNGPQLCSGAGESLPKAARIHRAHEK